MVIYYTDDNMRQSILSYLLDKKDVAYTVEIKPKDYPFKLLVDGVPLDFERAIDWVMSR